MKKNFITTANSLMLGVFAMTSLSLASCADENDLVNTVNQETAQTVSSNELMGTFTGTMDDSDFQKEVTAIVSDNNLTLSVGSEKTGFSTASAKLTSSADGKTLNGEFDEPFMDIKTFKFSKVGSYYFNMNCAAADGSTKELGFFKTLATRAVAQNGELELSYMKGVAKQSVGALIDLVPGAKFVISPLTDMLFADDKEPDMPVSKCYEQLSKAIQQLSQQVSELQSAFKEETSLNRLKEHNTLRAGFETTTRNYVNNIISLKESEDPTDKDSINLLVKKWGDRYAVDARRFIFDTMDGVSLNNDPYSSIIDAMAEKKFAWEHQGYYFREMYRLSEIACVAECAAMLAAYGELNPLENDPNLANNLNKIALKFKANEVVVDNENAICQITGAHHLKLKRSFSGFDDYAKAHLFQVPCMEATEDLGFLVVPVYDKDKNYASNAEYIKARDAMMTVDEAKAIMNYYGYNKSMCDILREEAGIKCYPLIHDYYPRILLLYGTKSYSANEKTRRIESGGNVQYRTKDIYFDTVCYFQKTKDAFSSFYVGTIETRWEDWGGWQVPPFYYNGWAYPNYSNYDFINFTVVDRDNNWNPGNYIKKQ